MESNPSQETESTTYGICAYQEAENRDNKHKGVRGELAQPRDIHSLWGYEALIYYHTLQHIPGSSPSANFPVKIQPHDLMLSSETYGAQEPLTK